MAEAAKIRGARHIGSLIVMKFGTPVAIVTEGTSSQRCLPAVLTCYDPGKRGHALSSHQDMPDAGDQGKGRLAVFECGELAVVITASDLIREMPDAP